MKKLKQFLKTFTISLVILTISSFGLVGYMGGFKERIKFIEVPEKERSVKELIKENADRYHVNPILIAAIAERESGYKPESIRFEAHHMSIAAKITRNPDEQRMYASSIGVMQIMAWHAPKYGLTYRDLFNNKTNIEVGTVILKNCLDKWKGETKYNQIKKAATCYNGSEEYGMAIVNRLGQLLIENSL